MEYQPKSNEGKYMPFYFVGLFQVLKVNIYIWKKTSWSLFMDGVQLPKEPLQFKEAAYFLPLSSQKFMVLIGGWKAATESTWSQNFVYFLLFHIILISRYHIYFRTILLCIKTKRFTQQTPPHPLLLMDKIC